MDLGGDELLADPALTEDEDRNLHRRRALDRHADERHRGAVPHQSRGAAARGRQRLDGLVGQALKEDDV